MFVNNTNPAKESNILADIFFQLEPRLRNMNYAGLSLKYV